MKQAYIVIRVPSEQLVSISDEVKSSAIEVVRESVTGRDVTDEFVDLSSQLENLQATEARVQTFLDQATDVEGALAVNRELGNLQEQIAVISGRLKFLRESADHSSLSITLMPEYEAPPIEVANWRPKGSAGNTLNVLINLAQGFVNLLIWFIIVGLPILLVIGGVVWGERLYGKKLSNRSNFQPASYKDRSLYDAGWNNYYKRLTLMFQRGIFTRDLLYNKKQVKEYSCLRKRDIFIF